MAVMRGNPCFLGRRRLVNAAPIGNIKKRLKMPNLPKYEGKYASRFSVLDPGQLGSISPLNFRSLTVKALLILGNQSSSDMFTSYSHAPLFPPLPRA